MISLIALETGIPFDLETLGGGGGGKREKKVSTPTTKDEEEKPDESSKKVVGWQYRYRVSKMLEAQKHEGAQRVSKTSSKKEDPLPPHERLDPQLARLTPEQRVVGWVYRFVHSSPSTFLLPSLGIAFAVNSIPSRMSLGRVMQGSEGRKRRTSLSLERRPNANERRRSSSKWKNRSRRFSTLMISMKHRSWNTFVEARAMSCLVWCPPLENPSVFSRCR